MNRFNEGKVTIQEIGIIINDLWITVDTLHEIVPDINHVWLTNSEVSLTIKENLNKKAPLEGFILRRGLLVMRLLLANSS
jgi:hypothetical protein